MNSDQFEAFVANNKDLNLLINKQNFGVLSSIKKTDEMTKEFINWVSPKYYEAFVKVYKKYYLDKRGVVYALFRTSFLANEATLEKISKTIQRRLEYTLDRTKKFHESIALNPKNCVSALPTLDFPFDREATAIFENFKSQTIAEKRNEYRQYLMAIAKILNQFSPRKNEVEHRIYMSVRAELILMDMTPEQKQELEKQQLKFSGKAVWSILGIVIILIIIMLRCGGGL
ncbi:MAG: hypothetical protein GQ574_01235 [Crocinitomix sp.]|nr:hypothetical protein [Crocinitomix sp.]